METRVDSEKFDQLQEIFARDLIERIRLKLLEAGIAGNTLKEVTGEIAFSVTSALDNIAIIEKEGVEAHPYLTFVDDDEQLIHCGENSYAHELIASLMDDVFRK